MGAGGDEGSWQVGSGEGGREVARGAGIGEREG